MIIKDIEDRLEDDLYKLGLPINEVSLSFRPYSKTFYGRYFPANDDSGARIYIYPFKNIKEELYPYNVIIETAIHEVVHHIQYTNKNFKRLKGVMHNEQFWILYNHYVNSAKTLSMIDKEFNNAKAKESVD